MSRADPNSLPQFSSNSLMQSDINLFVYVANNPINRLDSEGLWTGGQHKDMTKKAFNNLNMGPEMSNCLKDLVKGNTATDHGKMGSDNVYHFNRDVGQNTAEGYRNAIKAYQDKMKEIETELNSNLASPDQQNCQKGLELIGRLTHMWQDYYGHAVPASYNGFGTVGAITGDPYNVPSNVKPSSWGGLGGEHSVGSEPGNRAVDSTQRQQASIDFTQSHLKPLLSKWKEVCKCCKGKK